MENLDQYRLGESKESLLCIGAEESQAVALALIQQADRFVDIFTHDLEPAMYDTDECHDALLEVARRGRFSRVRILIQEPVKVARRGHRLLELGRRLSSSIQMLRASERFQAISNSFLIVDKIGLLQRPYRDSYKAIANFSDPVLAKELSGQFENIWNEAEPDPYLRYFV
jgi:hypothetical protein